MGALILRPRADGRTAFLPGGALSTGYEGYEKRINPFDVVNNQGERSVKMKKVFHILIASAVCALAAGGEAAQIAFKKFESIPGGEADVASFVCSVASGVYSPGESVEVRLKVKAAKADISVALQVRNFAGREIYRSESRKLAEEMRTESFALPPAEELGLFTVSAVFSRDGRIFGYTETAYAVAPPPAELEDRDAFFVVDKNFALPELLPEMKRFGFGTAFVTLPDMAWAIHTPAEKREAEYAKFAGVEWMKELKVDGFHLMGAMRPNMKRTPKPTARIKKGLFALTDQDLETVRDHSRRMAELLKDRIPVDHSGGIRCDSRLEGLPRRPCELPACQRARHPRRARRNPRRRSRSGSRDSRHLLQRLYVADAQIRDFKNGTRSQPRTV